MTKLISYLSIPILIFISSCGGGGGSNGGGSNITYTGSSSQAVISDTNAENLATDTYQGGALGGITQKPGADSQASRPVSISILNILRQTMQKIKVPGGNRTATVSNSETGGCGGSYSYTLTVNDSTGDFTGTFTYSGYCSMGTISNGTLTVSGNISGSTMSLTITFSNYGMTTGGDSFTVTGTAAFNSLVSSTGYTLNLVYLDNTASKVYKLENFVISSTSGMGYVDISMSGRFYHPDHGYIDITTPTATPFRYMASDIYPSQGVLVLTGAGGATVKLTVIDNTQLQIEADANGDGDYVDSGDYSNTISWTSI